jgi:hypothetical protein
MYDSRLSGYANEVTRSINGVIASLQELVKLLEDHRASSLQQSERMLLFPGLELIADGLVTLKQAMGQLQINKT